MGHAGVLSLMEPHRSDRSGEEFGNARDRCDELATIASQRFKLRIFSITHLIISSKASAFAAIEEDRYLRAKLSMPETRTVSLGSGEVQDE